MNLIHLLRNMTLEEKIGQMVMVGLEGYEVNTKTIRLLEKDHVGGFILFRKNCQDSRQLLTLLNALKDHNRSSVPLFFAIDEEGGRVTRLPEEIRKIPSNQVIGQVNNDRLCYSIGRVIGEAIRSFGFNMNFAPVLDINSNPLNPVIGDRSFGIHPDRVTPLGISTMKGMQVEKIISVVKHFPGHGDTFVDSHFGLPILHHDLNRLKGFEWIPFTQAIQNQVEAIMTAHILLPKIDLQFPATLSKKMITDCLRNILLFPGVVVTDDLTMGAITQHYSIEEAALLAVQAGCDLILVANGYENGQKALLSMRKAVEAGHLTLERIDESVKRILQLKNKYTLRDTVIPSIDIDKINQQIKEILSFWDN